MTRYHLQRVTKGQPVSADWANAIVDTLVQLSDALARLERSLYERTDALVELTSDLPMGGEATAKVLYRDDEPNTWKDAATREITVYDAIGGMQAESGDKALVKYNKQAAIWIVWQVVC